MYIKIQNKTEQCVTLKTDKNCYDYLFFEIPIFYSSKLSIGLFFYFCVFFLNDYMKKVYRLVFTSLSPKIKNLWCKKYLFLIYEKVILHNHYFSPFLALI